MNVNNAAMNRIGDIFRHAARGCMKEVINGNK
jgi:hypothetical protein